MPSEVAITTPTSGTAEIKRPASELVILCSALASISHGTPISTAASAASGIQLLSTPRSSPRATTIGSKMRAPIEVRAKTSTTGDRSLTAIRMNRYGMPQITLMATNSKRPRLVTQSLTPDALAKFRHPPRMGQWLELPKSSAAVR